jgi:hypothetical protein
LGFFGWMIIVMLMWMPSNHEVYFFVTIVLSCFVTLKLKQRKIQSYTIQQME